MTSYLPVAARSLLKRRVRLRDTVLEQASLFPFFDRQGRVSALMLVSPPRREIVMLDLDADLIQVPWWGEIEIRSTLEALGDVDAGLAAYPGLRHYDPWWVLRDACFEGHPAVPALKATNCAGGFLKPVVACYFTGDLSRLAGVSTASKAVSGVPGLDPGFIRFTPQLLPEMPELCQPAKRRNWRLDPFWLEKAWKLGSRSC